MDPSLLNEAKNFFSHSIGALLLLFLVVGCAHNSGQYAIDKGPLQSDFEAVALVIGWGYKQDIKLKTLVASRSDADAVYLSYKTDSGEILNFKVHRNPKKVELIPSDK